MPGFAVDNWWLPHRGQSAVSLARIGRHRTSHRGSHACCWLRRKGELNERQARMHPRKNVLAQALGAGHQYLKPPIGHLDYQAGDQFVLCSDGLIEGLWDRGIEEIVRVPETAEDAPVAQRLVLSSVAECGRYNATAVVIRTDID